MATFVPQELYGIIGHNLSKSMSPLMHNTGFQVSGHSGVMLLWNIEPGRARDFIPAVRLLNIRGCCVTIPHKVDIVPYLDKQSERVKLIGACNTLYWEGDKLCGENTDIIGFLAPLKDLNLPKSSTVVILGAGGAARAAIAGLKMQGFEDVTVVQVVKEFPAELAAAFNLRRAKWDDRFDLDADIIINATPLGMAGKHDGKSPYSFEAFKAKKPGIAYDLVYTPAQTPFLLEAEKAGWKTISGQAMFFSQGNHQFKLWTGRDLPPEAIDVIKRRLAGQPA